MDDVKELSIKGLDSKTKIRINNDDNMIIELNLSDPNILVRLEDTSKSINELEAKYKLDNLSGSALTEAYTNLDQDLRNLVDNLFEYPVSKVLSPKNSMLELNNGKYRFETIIESLGSLYSVEINNEIKKLNSRISKHTNKYTK